MDVSLDTGLLRMSRLIILRTMPHICPVLFVVGMFPIIAGITVSHISTFSSFKIGQLELSPLHPPQTTRAVQNRMCTAFRSAGVILFG